MEQNEKKVVQKSICNYLESRGIHFHENIQSAGDRRGTEDVTCCYKGRYIAIECKLRGKETIYRVQRVVKKNVENNGGIHIFAYNYVDVVALLKKIDKGEI